MKLTVLSFYFSNLVPSRSASLLTFSHFLTLKRYKNVLFLECAKMALFSKNGNIDVKL